jgi:Na+/melibiose symporter-like transporter
MGGMGFYCLIGLANYSASIGFGIATVAVGGILTFTRIFDAVTDPLLAFYSLL